MQHFQFARRQRFEFFAFGEPVGHFRGNPVFARRHGAQGGDELFAGGTFQNITLRPGGDGFVNVFVAVKCRQHQDAGGGVLVPNFLCRLNPAFERHPRIQQNQVGYVFVEQFNRLSSVGGFGHDFHVRFIIDDRNHAHADDIVIVGDKDRVLTSFFMVFS